jgi:ABC-2 type transport system permease protein
MDVAVSLQKPLIFVWRDLLEKASYRFAMVLGFGGVLLNIAIFFYLAKLVQTGLSPHLHPYGGDYFPFVLIGLAFSRYLGTAMASFGSTIRAGQIMGTLEAILVTPTRLSTVLVASSLWPFLGQTLSVIAYLLIGVLVFGADLGQANLAGAAAILALTIVAFGGLGLVSAGFMMVFKRGDPVSAAVHSISVLIGGVYYPVTILPDWLQSLADWLPMTHALRGMRLALLQGEPVSNLLTGLATLGLFGAVLLPVGVFVFGWAIRKAKRDGTLLHY